MRQEFLGAELNLKSITDSIQKISTAAAQVITATKTPAAAPAAVSPLSYVTTKTVFGIPVGFVFLAGAGALFFVFTRKRRR